MKILAVAVLAAAVSETAAASSRRPHFLRASAAVRRADDASLLQGQAPSPEPAAAAIAEAGAQVVVGAPSPQPLHEAANIAEAPAAAPEHAVKAPVAADIAEAPASAPEPGAAAPAGLAPRPEKKERKEERRAGEMKEERQAAPEKPEEPEPTELQSVLLRFELRNVDYNHLDDPVHHEHDKSDGHGDAVTAGHHDHVDHIEHADGSVLKRGSGQTVTTAKAMENAIVGSVEHLLAERFGLKQGEMKATHGHDGEEILDPRRPHDDSIGSTVVTLQHAAHAAHHKVPLLAAPAPAGPDMAGFKEEGPAALSPGAPGPAPPLETADMRGPSSVLAPLSPAPARAADMRSGASGPVLAAPAPAARTSRRARRRPQKEERIEDAGKEEVEKPHEERMDNSDRGAARPEKKDDGPVKTLPLISCMFEPGVSKPMRELLLLSGKKQRYQPVSTIAKVRFVDRPGTGADRLDEVEKVLKEKVLDGSLQGTIAHVVREVTHEDPAVGEIDETMDPVHPVNLTACAVHLDKMVKRFSAAYTRSQVPKALLHACENYRQMESFSHDNIVDRVDRERCRVATKKFIKLWQFGKGKVNYGSWCLDICEMKNGKDAIRCDAYKYIHKGH